LKLTVLAAAFVALVLAAPALAADPSIGRTAFTLPDSKDTQETFRPDAPKIVLHVELLDMENDTKISADWIAEKTGAAPPNYKIDSSELTANGDDEATLSLSKPNNGWPVGDYRVDLSIDGKKVKSIKFQVAQ
jgi:hypothetical protein